MPQAKSYTRLPPPWSFVCLPAPSSMLLLQVIEIYHLKYILYIFSRGWETEAHKLLPALVEVRGGAEGEEMGGRGS